MGYIKTNWVNGTTPLNADNLNKIEDGIYDLYTSVNSNNVNVVDSTVVSLPNGVDGFITFKSIKGKTTGGVSVNGDTCFKSGSNTVYLRDIGIRKLSSNGTVYDEIIGNKLYRRINESGGILAQEEIITIVPLVLNYGGNIQVTGGVIPNTTISYCMNKSAQQDANTRIIEQFKESVYSGNYKFTILTQSEYDQKKLIGALDSNTIYITQEVN